MKRGSGKAKGGAFERLICKRLSSWWTDGERDDVFYRTASSGGRATQRTKRGQKTFGQYGDIQAADPVGQPLMDLCVIECKDGYASDSIADLLDKEERHHPQYEQFIKQAAGSADDADRSYWLLICRRRGRQIMIFLPEILWIDLKQVYPTNPEPRPRIVLSIKGYTIAGMPFEQFLNRIKPECVKEVLE